MEEEIIERIGETLRIARNQISPQTPLRELVEDSLDAFELLAVLSEDYQLRLDPSQINELETVADLAAHIEANRGSAERGQSLKTI